MGSLHAAHHAWNVKLAGLRRSGDRTRPQLAGCRETEGFDSSWLALLFVKRSPLRLGALRQEPWSNFSFMFILLA